jgi:N-acetylneuraminic acid mutarotase
MVLQRRHLVVFGGFHDNNRECKYFNDVHAFDLDNRKWKKLEVTGAPPNPRSGCCMFSLADGRIIVFGGYAKEKGKKDSEKGVTMADMFVFAPDSKCCFKRSKAHKVDEFILLSRAR